MSSLQMTPLESFHEFVTRKLRAQGAREMSPEQALAQWREQEETLEAIREGLDDVAAGRTRPAEDILRELRAELGETRS